MNDAKFMWSWVNKTSICMDGREMWHCHDHIDHKYIAGRRLYGSREVHALFSTPFRTTWQSRAETCGEVRYGAETGGDVRRGAENCRLGFLLAHILFCTINAGQIYVYCKSRKRLLTILDISRGLRLQSRDRYAIYCVVNDCPVCDIRDVNVTKYMFTLPLQCAASAAE